MREFCEQFVQKLVGVSDGLLVQKQQKCTTFWHNKD